LFFIISKSSLETADAHPPHPPNFLTQTWVPSTQVTTDTIYLDDLEVSFHRTVRVPDGPKSSALPPSLGKFPLYQVKDYVEKLPEEMAAKGGLFLPMYRTYLAMALYILLTRD